MDEYIFVGENDENDQFISLEALRLISPNFTFRVAKDGVEAMNLLGTPPHCGGQVILDTSIGSCAAIFRS